METQIPTNDKLNTNSVTDESYESGKNYMQTM